jgi:hypothetical protein
MFTTRYHGHKLIIETAIPTREEIVRYNRVMPDQSQWKSPVHKSLNIMSELGPELF